MNSARNATTAARRPTAKTTSVTNGHDSSSSIEHDSSSSDSSDLEVEENAEVAKSRALLAAAALSLSDDGFSDGSLGSRGKGKGKEKGRAPQQGSSASGVAGGSGQTQAAKPAKNPLQASVDRARGRDYIHWSVHLLQKVCKHRHIRGMARVKGKEDLAAALRKVDEKKGRGVDGKPYEGDFEALLGEKSRKIIAAKIVRK